MIRLTDRESQWAIVFWTALAISGAEMGIIGYLGGVYWWGFWVLMLAGFGIIGFVGATFYHFMALELGVESF